MLKKALAPLENPVYALLRIFAGLMFAFHGLQKLFGVLSTQPSPPVGSQFWIGGVIELVCGVLIGVGFFTRWAALIASGEMAVAYLQFHWRFHGGPELIPKINKGELALLYSWLFLFIACRGAGWWSVDAKRAREAERQAAP